MARRKINDSRVLLTGASGGIGKAIALELARCGARQVLVARREEKLCEVQNQIVALGGQAETVLGDITESCIRNKALQTCQERLGGLDMLVNNAGVGGLGFFDQADPERLRRIMEVNFFAAAELIRAAVPLLAMGKTPMVINVSSILGHRGLPFCSEYCASKFALQGFSESLRAEFARLKIDLLVVSPGTTQTDFSDHVIGGMKELPWSNPRGVPASHVARATVRAIRRGAHEIIPNRLGRMLCWLNRFSPRLADWLVGRYVK